MVLTKSEKKKSLRNLEYLGSEKQKILSYLIFLNTHACRKLNEKPMKKNES